MRSGARLPVDASYAWEFRIPIDRWAAMQKGGDGNDEDACSMDGLIGLTLFYGKYAPAATYVVTNSNRTYSSKILHSPMAVP